MLHPPILSKIFQLKEVQGSPWLCSWASCATSSSSSHWVESGSVPIPALYPQLLQASSKTLHLSCCVVLLVFLAEDASVTHSIQHVGKSWIFFHVLLIPDTWFSFFWLLLSTAMMFFVDVIIVTPGSHSSAVLVKLVSYCLLLRIPNCFGFFLFLLLLRTWLFMWLL